MPKSDCVEVHLIHLSFQLLQKVDTLKDGTWGLSKAKTLQSVGERTSGKIKMLQS
jgi:hypothetical protein